MNWNEKLINEYASLSDDELRRRFSSAGPGEGLGWLGGKTDDPFEWIEKYGEQLRKKICKSRSIKKYHSSTKEQEKVQLYCLVGDAVMTYFTGISCLIIAEIIVRRGLGLYCKDIWTVKRKPRLTQ